MTGERAALGPGGGAGGAARRAGAPPLRLIASSYCILLRALRHCARCGAGGAARRAGAALVASYCVLLRLIASYCAHAPPVGRGRGREEGGGIWGVGREVGAARQRCGAESATH